MELFNEPDPDEFDIEEEEDELDFDENEDYPFDDVFGPVAGRGPAPWYGYPPRVLAVDLRRPLRPRLVLWRKGEIVEDFILKVDRRAGDTPLPRVQATAEAFSDYCRKSGLYGAYLAACDYLDGGTPLQAAVYTAVILEADWAGMLIAKPTPLPGPGQQLRLKSYTKRAVRIILKNAGS